VDVSRRLLARWVSRGWIKGIGKEKGGVGGVRTGCFGMQQNETLMNTYVELNATPCGIHRDSIMLSSSPRLHLRDKKP